MTSDEKRFAMGLGVIVFVTAAVVTVLNFVDTNSEGHESVENTTAVAPTVSDLSPGSSELLDNSDIAIVASPADLSGAEADAPGVGGEGSDGGEGVSGGYEVQEPSEQAAAESTEPVPHVIDPVPLAYFAPDSNTLNLPPVLEKYIERVDRGTRFMARLETIVADQSFADEVVTGALDLSFTAQSHSERLSYNAVHSTQWVEAAFPTSNAPSTQDVLVDVRRGASREAPGERLAFFFASVLERDGAMSFALDDGVANGDHLVIVYALDDALSPLGAAVLETNAD